MASQVPPKKGVAFTFETALVPQTNLKIFKTTPTLAAGDVKVSKDGGSFSNITSLPTEIGSTGALTVSLTATEMNADRVVVLFHDQSGDEWCDQMVVINTASQQIDDLSTLTAASVWSYSTRTLTSFGSLVSDIAAAVWGYATRTITSGGITAAEIWSYVSRTLTQTAAEVQEAMTGTNIVIHRGDTWSWSLTGLGNISARTKLYFTLKSSTIHADSDALVQVEETGGLLRLNGAAVESGDGGELAVDDETSGDITITLSAATTAQLTPAPGLVYDVQMVTATGVDTLTQASATVTADVTRSVT